MSAAPAAPAPSPATPSEGGAGVGAGILVNAADLDRAPPAVREYLLSLLRPSSHAPAHVAEASAEADITTTTTTTSTTTTNINTAIGVEPSKNYTENDTQHQDRAAAHNSNNDGNAGVVEAAAPLVQNVAVIAAATTEDNAATTTEDNTVAATTATPVPPPAAAPPTPAPSSNDGVVVADPQAGFKALAKQVADMATELSLLRSETKMLRDVMAESGVLKSNGAAREPAAAPTGSRDVMSPSLQARVLEAQRRAWEYGGGAAPPPPHYDGDGDGDACASPGPPPFSPLSDIAGSRTSGRSGDDDTVVAASVPGSPGPPVLEPDEHVAAVPQLQPKTPQRRHRGGSHAQPRQPDVTSAPRPAMGTFPTQASVTPAAPGSRPGNTADAVFSRAQFDLDPHSSPVVARAHSLPGLPERRQSVAARAPASAVREIQPRPARVKRYKDVEYEWKAGQGGDVLLLKPTPEQYADLKGNQDDCPLLFLCAEELGARRHGAFIIEIPEASRPAIPEQPARDRICTVYKQQKLASGFWRLYTSSGRRTIPQPGAFESVGLDDATREFEKRLSVGKTLKRVAYETDIPAHTPEERAEALLPQESPVYPLRGNKLEITGIPGIHTPSAYRGTTCAPFAWHFEDLKLGAINCLYRGQKVWFVTEPASFDAASKVFGEVTKKAVDHDQFLRHDALHYGASHLRSQGIVTRGFMQDAWQMVAVYPGAYHSGFSATGTLAEAVNYADHWWTAPVGYRPCSEKCHPGREPITLEQLIPGERCQSPDEPPSPTSIKVQIRPLGPPLRAMGHVDAIPAEKTPGKRSGSTRPSDVSVGEPPPKRVKELHRPPSLEVLALELTGPSAEQRLRRQMLAYSRYPDILPQPWDNEASWAQQTKEYINLGNDMKRRNYSAAPTEFTKLVGLVARATAAAAIYTGDGGRDIERAADAKQLSKRAIEQVRDSLGIEMKSQPFKFWLAAQRKFMRIGLNNAPFLPFESSRDAAFRDYERVGNAEIEEIRTMLNNDPRARKLAWAGQGLICRIWGKKDFLWEHISNGGDDIEKLDDDTLISLVPVRYAEQCHVDSEWKPLQEMPELERPDAVQGKHCELCEGEACGCIRTCFPQEPRVSFAEPNGLSVRAAVAYKKGDLIGEVTGVIHSPGTVAEDGHAVDFVRPDGSSPPVPRVVGRIITRAMGNVFRLCKYRCGDAEARLMAMAISGRCRMVVVAERDIGESDEISIKTQNKAEPCACSDCAP
ncbi:hypothetical protein RB595_000445 [Gaeumannomyces hyphopodioides]